MKRNIVKLLLFMTIMLLLLSACKKEEKTENDSVPMQEERLQETPSEESEDVADVEMPVGDSVQDVIEEPELTLSELKELANDISQRYGVEVRIADDCALEYAGYNGLLYEDEQKIGEALTVLENCLSKYPDGFMEQLHFGAIESIRIELVGTLTLNTGVDAVDAAGFTEEREDYISVVFDVDLFKEDHVYHELTHVIDKRLEWDMYTKEGALFSEETWLELQPEGFDYAYTYTDIPDSMDQYYGSDYFVYDYSWTFPSEDRATMMEESMCGRDQLFALDSPMYKKLEYYSACIRDTFDTTNWPEKTSWEEVL